MHRILPVSRIPAVPNPESKADCLMSTALVLFRRDLRLADNPALSAACAGHDRVLPVYVHAPSEEAPWQPGAAGLWWLVPALARHLLNRVAEQPGMRHLSITDDALTAFRSFGAIERRIEMSYAASAAFLRAREDA